VIGFGNDGRSLECTWKATSIAETQKGDPKTGCQARNLAKQWGKNFTTRGFEKGGGSMDKRGGSQAGGHVCAQKRRGPGWVWDAGSV